MAKEAGGAAGTITFSTGFLAMGGGTGGMFVLIAASLAGISSISIIPYLFYPFLLAVCVIISIFVSGKRRSKKTA